MPRNNQQNNDSFENLTDLQDLARRLRTQNSKCQLIFAHNGTGKNLSISRRFIP